MRWIEKARRANLDRYAAALPNPAMAHADHSEVVDDEDARLDAYNAWLAQAAANDRRQAPTQRPE
jgi:hypothetical protein